MKKLAIQGILRLVYRIKVQEPDLPSPSHDGSSSGNEARVCASWQGEKLKLGRYPKGLDNASRCKLMLERIM